MDTSGRSVHLPVAHAASFQQPRMPRSASFKIPDKFRDGDDALEDVTAPKSIKSHYMNQSILSVIGYVGSNTGLEPHRAAKDRTPSMYDPRVQHGPRVSHRAEGMSNSAPDHARQRRGAAADSRDGSSEREATRRLPDYFEAPQHLGTLHLPDEDMSSSQILTPHPYSAEGKPGNDTAASGSISSSVALPRDGQSDGRSSSDSSGEQSQMESARAEQSSIGLVERLVQTFGFDSPEKILAEFPCWLLQSVLLQGHMYVTSKHICYYAYLPRKSDAVLKSGFLFKRGKRNPKFNRYWFVLKDHTLSYYKDPSNLHFPRGNLDLRSGISAQITPGSQQSESTAFTITNSDRAHQFRAESPASAKEWVKQTQKAIFRSHNEGDTVKICLPIENILDLEENPVLDFADTFRIRIIDNDETYAIDEYFFSFFSHGKDALSILGELIGGNNLNTSSIGMFSQATTHLPRKTHHARARQIDDDNVSKRAVEATKATSDRSDRDSSGRRQTTVDNTSNQPVKSSMSSISPLPEHVGKDAPALRDSSDSSRSSDDSQDDSQHSGNTEAESKSHLIRASQILSGSDVFRQSTLQALDPRHAPGHPSTLPESGGTSNEESHPDAQSTSRSGAVSSSCQLPSGESAASQLNMSRITIQPSSSSRSLRDLVRAGVQPLDKATGLAGLLWARSQQVRTYVSSESKGYYEKVSGMWAGKRVHFDDTEGVGSTDQIRDLEEDEARQTKRFHSHFALPDSEKLVATYHGYLSRLVPVFGKFYLGATKLCFRSLLPGTRTNMILPLKDVESIDKENGFRFGYSGLVVVVRGHEELFFEFSQPDARDDLAVSLLQNLEFAINLQQSQILSQEERLEIEAAKAEYDLLEHARQTSSKQKEPLLKSIAQEPDVEAPPILFDDPLASIVDFKPRTPQKITCLTIGSRGDVQPYIALCIGLLKEGHRPKIATHCEFESWVRHYGIDFAPVAGDPAEIMRLCVEHDMFTISFMREVRSRFRGWMDQLLESSWRACQGTDILIESPSAMSGVHIAEALQIPYFRAFTMPWTRTRAYPHAFAVPMQKLGGNYNTLSYVMFDNVFWQGQSGQINRWRAKTLGLAPTSLDKMQLDEVPFFYNFSPSVVAPPIDFNPWIRVTGYWFLDEGEKYKPPEDLMAFIRQARQDGKKIIYVGFGSIVVDKPALLTRTVVDSVLKADVRCVLSKGWSDRLEKLDVSEAEFPLPAEIFQIKHAPHDWLFAQIDAAVHHGGAGTTGASLRAGIPTVVKPFFGDQFFFGSRVEDLGVGIYMRIVNTSVFARALWEATNSERIIVKARSLGEQIRSEQGVDNAIQAIYRDLEYAKSLVEKKAKPKQLSSEEAAESWTLVGDESDSD